MSEFKPEYPGDTPNRKWVRDKIEEKGIRVDTTESIMRLPSQTVKLLFGVIITAEWPRARY